MIRVFDDAEVSVTFIIEVPGFSVKDPGPVVMFQIVPVPVIVHVPDPMVSVRVFVVDDEKAKSVTFFPFASNVPIAREKVQLVDKAS